jgi:hypothetical protein
VRELVVIELCTLPLSAIELDLVLQVSLLRREVVRLSPHQTVLLESVYSKEEKQSPTEVYREFNNIMRLSGRE